MTTINEDTHETLFYAIGAHIHAIKESLDKTSKANSTNTANINALTKRLTAIESQLSTLPRIETMLRKLTMTEEEVKKEEWFDTKLDYILENSCFSTSTYRVIQKIAYPNGGYIWRGNRSKFTIRDLSELPWIKGQSEEYIYSYLKKHFDTIGHMRALQVLKDLKILLLQEKACN